MAKKLMLRSVWCFSIAGLALGLSGCSERVPPTSVVAEKATFTARPSIALVTAGDFSLHPNGFAANAISPNASSCTVGSTCSVDVGMWVGSGTYGGTYGVDFKVYFDPTVLQAVSVTTAAGSPYQNSPAIGDGHTTPANSIDNTLGIVSYSAMSAPGQGFNGGNPFAIATIQFNPINAGSSVLQLRPDQWLNAYGPFGNGGLATYGNVTVTGSAKTASTTTVSFGAGPFAYTGSAYAATATVSPAGNATIAYTGDCVNAGSTCTATATYDGDASHTGSSATASITITKAASSTTVSFGAGPFPYKGTAYAATATVSPAASVIIAYAGDCVNGGNSCTASASYAGDANHTGSQGSASIVITYAVCSATNGDIAEAASKATKGVQSGSTIPVMLRVCDAAGRNISSRLLPVQATSISPTGSLNDSGKANPGLRFRLDDGTYMFNLSTKGLTAGNYTLDYTIGNDPTVYHYAFVIRAAKSEGGDGKGEGGDDKSKGSDDKNKGGDDKGKGGDDKGKGN